MCPIAMQNTLTPPKTLSVTQAANLLGIGRTTVGYWIRTKKLHADRVGRNYTISVDALGFFLKSNGHTIPPELADAHLSGPFFRNFQPCWQYWQESGHDRNCENCVSFKNQRDLCFTTRNSGSLQCPHSCNECKYYQEIYLPRIQLIYQFDLPAALLRDFSFWGGNAKWAELCGVSERDLIGLGIESVIHPESLETVISDVKKRNFGHPEVPRTYSVFLKNIELCKDGDKLAVIISLYPLRDPAGTLLVLAEP